MSDVSKFNLTLECLLICILGHAHLLVLSTLIRFRSCFSFKSLTKICVVQGIVLPQCRSFIPDSSYERWNFDLRPLYLAPLLPSYVSQDFFFLLCRKTMRLNFRILRIFNILQRVPWDFMCKTTWLQYCILHKSLDQISSKWKLVFKIYIYIYVCIFRFLWLSFFVTLICSELFLAALLVFVCIWPLPLVPVT